MTFAFFIGCFLTHHSFIEMEWAIFLMSAQLFLLLKLAEHEREQNFDFLFSYERIVLHCLQVFSFLQYKSTSDCFWFERLNLELQLREQKK